ncbi:MAG: cupin fold metalloprotein, WbuC family [Bacteroidetes bacterium]|jgi:cupin fold WbuC family metalloprotein|nr:cupin fold metalloprotein, WbuC family [Bacteroidota bacterium]
MIHITDTLIGEISAQAQASPRKRMNYNFHEHYSDTLQRMINAMEPGTYVQPHKHEAPDKREAFVVLTGKVVVVEFDPEGNITDHIVLSSINGALGVEIAAKTYHMVIALEPGSAVYELKDGPYTPVDDKNFAPWAPAEGEAGCEAYLHSILIKLGLG